MYWALVAIIIGSVFAIWQITQTTVSNSISAIEYGRTTATFQTNLIKSVDEAAAGVREAHNEIDAARKEIAAAQEKKRQQPRSLTWIEPKTLRLQ